MLYPIVHGRAKALLGLVPVVRRRSSKAGSGIESLGDVVAGIQELQRDRDRYRKALGKISEVLDRMLG